MATRGRVATKTTGGAMADLKVGGQPKNVIKGVVRFFAALANEIAKTLSMASAEKQKGEKTRLAR